MKKSKTKSKNMDGVLRLENNNIVKEISRIGPCDGTTGCHYCRDWTLLVYKKQLLGKQQQQQQQPDKSIDPNQFIVKAGAFNVSVYHNDRPDTFQKSNCPEGSFDRNSTSTTSPLKSYAQTCKEWMKLPSQRVLPGYLLPLEFDTSLSTYDTSSSSDEEEEEEEEEEEDDNDDSDYCAFKRGFSDLYQQLVCDRQGISLAPAQLKHLIPVDKVAHSDLVGSCHCAPCCEVKHFDGCKSPNDLEMERAIVNESMARCLKEESIVMEERLKDCWSALVEFMAKVDVLDREFDCLVGPGLGGVADDFMKQYDQSIVMPFLDFWTPLVPGFKKKTPKKSDGPDMLTTVDNTFINYMDQVLKATEDFYMTFVSSTIITKLEQFKTSVETILKATDATLAGRFGATQFFFDEIKGQVDKAKAKLASNKKQMEIIKAKAATSPSPSSFTDDLYKLQHSITHVGGMLKDWFPTSLDEAMAGIPELYKNHDITKMLQGHAIIINLTINMLKTYASEKWKEQKTDIEQLKHIYLKESLPNVASRVEKVAHKEFRKKIKKVEQRFGSMRQGLRYILHCSLVKMDFNNDWCDAKSVILDDTGSFYNMMLKTMEALLREGELAESIAINTRRRELDYDHEELIQKRMELHKAFTFGIFTGQHELATVIKILVVAESKRLLSDNEAIQRELSLTKSIGNGGGARTKNKSSSDTGALSPLHAVLTAVASSGNGKSSKKTKKVKSSTSVTSTAIGSATDQEAPNHLLKDKVSATTSSTPTKKDEKMAQKKDQSQPEASKSNQAVKTSTKANTAISPKKDAPKTGTEKLPPPPGLSKQNQSAKPKTTTPISTPADNNQSDAKTEKVSPPGLNTKPTTGAPISDKKQQQTKAEKISPPPGLNTNTTTNAPISDKKQQQTKAEKISPPPGLNTNTTTSAPISDKKQQQTKVEKAPPPPGLTKQAQPKPVEVTTTTTPPTVKQDQQKVEKVHSFSRKRHQQPQATDSKLTSDTSTMEENQINSWNTPPIVSSSSSSKQTQQEESWASTVSAASSTSSREQPLHTKPEQPVTWNTLTPPASSTENSAWNEPTTSNLSSPPPSTTWSQTVTASKPPPSSSTSTAAWGQFSAQHTDSQKTNTPQKLTVSSGWGQPSTTVDNAGWGMETKASPITHTKAPEKKGWSNEWAAKAQGLDTNGGSTEEANEPPRQVNVSLKDILAKSQESPMTNNNNNNNLNLASGTVAPPPALGSSNSMMPPTTTSMNQQLYQLNQESLVNIVNSLRCENQQLQQSMASMQQALSMTMTLAKEREEQTLELFNTRKQADLEEARVYILSLEAKIKELETQTQSRPPPPPAGAFINQDLFADYRQEIRTDNDSHQQQHYHNGNNYQKRPPGKKYWRKPAVVKCSNCGESDHTSSECKDTCRYCGGLGHLSENCARPW